MNEIRLNNFKSAEARWARFGRYYAIFPTNFAFDVIEKYSKKGDYVIDPFAGRGTSIFASSVLGRFGLGIEINPVGWLFGYVKIKPAEKDKVIDRLFEIYNKRNNYNKDIEVMPEFYRICYCDEVLKFLLAARNHLNWQKNNVDATLMAFILNYLHGKIGECLSNQMMPIKSMSMNYSVEWWKKNNMIKAPYINPLDFILKKINFRYKNGIPNITDSLIIFGDSTNELVNISEQRIKNENKFSLLFTSPPYYSVNDYYSDHWLRLWLLGGSENQQFIKEKHKGKFGNKKDYYLLLDKVFGHCSNMMKSKSTVYVRTDKREFTFNTTIEILKKHFSNYSIEIIERPLTKDTKTQTRLYGDKTLKPGEVDIIMTSK